jgi:UDP-N-acetylglucosamine transferase subunit ALG13
MIFVTVGSAHQPFTRLLDAMDALAPSLGEPVFMQTGFSGYRGASARCAGYITFGEVHRRVSEATLVVGQASTGAVLMSRQYGKPLVLVPRDHRRNEILDDHQLQTARGLEDRSRMVQVVYEMSDLEAAVRRAQAMAREGLSYEADPERDRLLAAVRAAVERGEAPPP